MASSIGLTNQLVDWNHTLEFHRQIFDAIEKRRPVDARVAMIAHLSDARTLWGMVEEKAKRIDVTSAIEPIGAPLRAVKRARK